jgi:glutamyl-tRNA synthetase
VVVRGRDQLTTPPRQIGPADALGLPAIESWAPVPLVVGDDGERPAKRHGAVTLAQRREAGEQAGETLAILAASVGLCGPSERPSAAELIDRFDPGTIPTGDGTIPRPGE